MTYLPKNKYKILETSGNELQYLNGTPYKGFYIETSEGKFAGDNPYGPGPRLISIEKVKTKQTVNNIFESDKVSEYYDLRPGIVEFIKKTKPIISTKTKPQTKDYEIGVYVRYFAKKANSTIDYYEIDRKTYEQFKQKNKNYDFFSYTVGKLLWALEGDVEKSNSSQLKLKERFYPNISSLFPNLREFSRDKILENQQAKPGEFVFRDDLNREYVGPYHVHPNRGPMVGAKHVASAHPRLVFTKDIEKKDTLYIDTGKNPIIHGHDIELDNELIRLYKPSPINLSTQESGFTPSAEIRETRQQQGGTIYEQPTLPSPPPSTPSTPSTPSYGGGGGY